MPSGTPTDWAIGKIVREVEELTKNVKYTDYTEKVIYSDFIGVDEFQGGGIIKGWILAPHKGQGYNRLFGDTSVRWTRPGPLTRQIDGEAKHQIEKAGRRMRLLMPYLSEED